MEPITTLPMAPKKMIFGKKIIGFIDLILKKKKPLFSGLFGILEFN
jgi:hypothetical protein